MGLRGVGRLLAGVCLLSSLPQVSRADELGELSLEELLQMELNVAARKSRTIRESPGIVTLVTREEIVASGARDIMDILLRVPGLQFGIDVNNVVNLGIRGLWAHEGKVLLLIDGQEMDENLYSSLQFGGHYPLENVERIEIVRGPGSAIYGGHAELGVINVITRNGAAIDGVSASVAYGSTQKDFGHRTAALAYGTRLESGLDVSIAGAFGQSVRGEGMYRDFYGDSFETREGNQMQSGQLNVGVTFKGASLRYLYDDHRMTTRDGFGAVTPKYEQNFFSHHAELKYEAPVGPVTLTPKLNYRRQVPWQTTQKTDDAPFYDKTVDRYEAGLSASWDPMPELSVIAAAEGFQDHAFLNDDELVGFQTKFDNGKNEITYTNFAGYTQVLLDTEIANLGFGARYEKHSEFGDSFVPRAALTKVVDRFHFKLLFSKAFRAPGVENLRVSNGEVDPERTTVYEAEAGYKVADGLFVTANAFDVTVEDPIVYFYDDATGEDYVNEPQIGSRGAEVELRAVKGAAHASFSASIYDAAGKNEVALYDAGNSSALAGFAQLKIVANAGSKLSDAVGLDMSAVLLGPRRGYVDGDGTEIGEENPVMLFDTFVSWNDVAMKGLDLGFGVYNLFDSEYRLLQPYAGGHSPLPSLGREAFVRLTYAR